MILCLSLFLAACFTGFAGDKGTLTISFGNGLPPSRLAVGSGEIADMEYELTLEGPGMTVTRTIRGSSAASFELAPGTWNVYVRAIGKTPLAYQDTYSLFRYIFPERMLRALGSCDVDIQAGKSSTAAIHMKTATEVTNWEQFQKACDVFLYDGEFYGEEIFVINGTIEMGYRPWVRNGKTLTLMAEKDAMLVRGNDIMDSMFYVDEFSTLILGRPGMKGRLTINGIKDKLEPSDSTYSIIEVCQGDLVMNEGVTLTNNRNTIPSLGGGGAVYVSSGMGTFIMNGGTISNNEATGADGGGGVYVAGGSFIMKGGYITGNSAPSAFGGGGVYVDTGTFNKTGGTIYGSNAGPGLANSSYPGFPGQAVYYYKAGVNPLRRDTTAGPNIRLYAGPPGGFTTIDPSTVDPDDGYETAANWM